MLRAPRARNCRATIRAGGRRAEPLQLGERSSQRRLLLGSCQRESRLVGAAEIAPERRGLREVACQLRLDRRRDLAGVHRQPCALPPDRQVAEQPRLMPLGRERGDGSGRLVHSLRVSSKPGGFGACGGDGSQPLQLTGRRGNGECLIQQPVAALGLARADSEESGDDGGDDARRR